MVKTEEEIEHLRRSAQLVSECLAHVAQFVRPGVSAAYIDEQAEKFIVGKGARPAFKGYRGYPATVCVSVDNEVVHGIPTPDKIFREGSVVSVDVGVELNGYYGDCAYTFVLGNADEEVLRLVATTYVAVELGVRAARAGNRLGDIGFAIQQFVEKQQGFAVVREMVGHGIGKMLHEEPQVPNWGKRGHGMLLRKGMVLAIEPMVNMGTHRVLLRPDGWTVVTADGKPSCHFEHMVLVDVTSGTKLTTYSLVEQVYTPPWKHLVGILAQ